MIKLKCGGTAWIQRLGFSEKIDQASPGTREATLRPLVWSRPIATFEGVSLKSLPIDDLTWRFWIIPTLLKHGYGKRVNTKFKVMGMFGGRNRGFQCLWCDNIYDRDVARYIRVKEAEEIGSGF